MGESVEQRQYSRSQNQLKRFEKELETAPRGVELPPLEREENTKKLGNCVKVDTINITGLTKYSSDNFKALKAIEQGQCLYIEDINNLLRDMTNVYIKDGYVTSRAILPEQDLSNGSLNIQVIEGRVEGLQALNGAYTVRELAYAFPIRPNKSLNLRDIEQGVDQLARLPSRDPKTDIKAGDNIGGSFIIVDDSSDLKPWRGGLTIDNSGQTSTGETIISGLVSTDNTMGLNDFWTLSANTSLDGGDDAGAWGLNGFLSIPYGYFSASVSGGFFSYESIIQGAVGEIESRGTSWFASTSLDWLVYRDATRKLSLSTGLGLTDNNNFISDVRLLASSFRLAVLSLGVDYQERLFGGLISTSVDWRRGTNLIGADSILTVDEGPQRIFNKLDYTLNFTRPFAISDQNFLYTANLQGQFSDENLFSSERVSIGSPSAVRGFRAGGISGDEGTYLRQEINWFGLCCDISSGWLEGDLDVSAFVALDVGIIKNDATDDFERGVLKSVTGGGRIRVKDTLLSLSVSHGFQNPFFVSNDGFELNASLTYNF